LKAFCISHVKDVDGLASAALVVAATKAKFFLSDYDSIIDDLAKVPLGIDEFVLCDLGADSSNMDQFVERLASIAKRSKVTYIDHHFMSDSNKRKVRGTGVEMVHEITDCASMLTYRTFREVLPPTARVVALLGAVTDYMDNSPMANTLMEHTDRPFVLLEASMLAYALAKRGDVEAFPRTVVRELAKMKLPHEIAGVPETAVQQLDATVKLSEEVKKKGKKIGRVAYMVTSEYSTGNVAKLLIGGFDVPVGVSLKEGTKGWYQVSLRSTSECKVHLGKTIAKISAGLGGGGGGHKMAAGCRIPSRSARDMLKQLAAVV
jgi:RecJ-like exonuclease